MYQDITIMMIESSSGSERLSHWHRSVCQMLTMMLMKDLILVGKDPRLWKSASWAPWEKSSRRWVRFGHLWWKWIVVILRWIEVKISARSDIGQVRDFHDSSSSWEQPVRAHWGHQQWWDHTEAQDSKGLSQIYSWKQLDDHCYDEIT